MDEANGPHHPGGSRPRAKAWAAGLEAARRRANLTLPDWLSVAADRYRRLLAQWIAAELAPGRLAPWLPVAFGCGIVLYFTADREPAWWAASSLALATFGIAVAALRRPVAFPLTFGLAAVALGFAVATVHTARLSHPILSFSTSRAQITGFVETREERAFRSHCRADGSHRRRPPQYRTESCARFGAQGHGADGRQLRRLQGASCPAITAVAAGRIQVRARSLFHEYRRLRLCARKDQDPVTADRRRCLAALCGLRRRDTRDDRRTHPRRGTGRRRIDRVGADYRQARCDLRAGQQCDVHLEPRARAVDLRLSHGDHCRHRVLLPSRGTCSHPFACDTPADQEMGGGRSARRGHVLSAVVGRRSGDATLLHYDRHCPDRHHH